MMGVMDEEIMGVNVCKVVVGLDFELFVFVCLGILLNEIFVMC